MPSPTFTPLLNRLKRVYSLANGSTSIQDLIKKFSGLAQLPPEEAAEKTAFVFHEMMNKIGPHKPQHLKGVEEFLSGFADIVKDENPSLTEQVNKQLEHIRKLNGAAKFEALKELMRNKGLSQYFAEYWQKYFKSQTGDKMSAMQDIFKANLTKFNQENSAAAQQIIYSPEGRLVSQFVRLLTTTFDMALVMADLDPVFKPDDSAEPDNKRLQFMPPMPK